jgi:YidC/Oxa1 family membrane protein insertase
MSLDVLYAAVSWVLLRWHQLFSAIGLPPGDWALSIVLLVITVRLLLFPLFIRQVHYQRRVQQLQPKIATLRERHRDDRAAEQRELLKLQQEEGFNPLAGCLPLLVQIPIFISLYHVLRHLANSAHLLPPSPRLTLYTFTSDETISAARAKLFGAPLAGSLQDAAHLDAFMPTLAVLLVSAAATYLTQLLVRRTQPAEPGTPAATVQRLMLYGVPAGVLISGLVFPLGVLLYWLTSNVWTLAQQAYVNRFHPPRPPASPERRTVAPG